MSERPVTSRKRIIPFHRLLSVRHKGSALVLRERDTLAAAFVVWMPLSDVQLGGIAVPGNEVGFLGVALAVLSEDGEGLGNRACNVFHFRTSVIQVLKKLKSRDSNRALFRNFFITLKKGGLDRMLRFMLY